MQYEILVVEGTETPIERAKKAEKIFFRKKKKHTIKTQVVIAKESKKIICTSFANGKRHDFRIFKESMLSSFS